MKQLLIYILLLLPVISFAQTPEVVKIPTGPNTVENYNGSGTDQITDVFAIAATNAAESVVVFTKGTYIIDRDITVDKPIYVMPQAKIKVLSGATATFEGAITASNDEHFIGDGEFSFIQGASDINASWFGLISDARVVEQQVYNDTLWETFYIDQFHSVGDSMVHAQYDNVRSLNPVRNDTLIGRMPKGLAFQVWGTDSVSLDGQTFTVDTILQVQEPVSDAARGLVSTIIVNEDLTVDWASQGDANENKSTGRIAWLARGNGYNKDFNLALKWGNITQATLKWTINGVADSATTAYFRPPTVVDAEGGDRESVLDYLGNLRFEHDSIETGFIMPDIGQVKVKFVTPPDSATAITISYTRWVVEGTDNSEAFRRTFDVLTEGGTVRMPAGNYATVDGISTWNENETNLMISRTEFIGAGKDRTNIFYTNPVISGADGIINFPDSIARTSVKYGNHWRASDFSIYGNSGLVDLAPDYRFDQNWLNTNAGGMPMGILVKKTETVTIERVRIENFLRGCIDIGLNNEGSRRIIMRDMDLRYAGVVMINSGAPKEYVLENSNMAYNARCAYKFDHKYYSNVVAWTDFIDFEVPAEQNQQNIRVTGNVIKGMAKNGVALQGTCSGTESVDAAIVYIVNNNIFQDMDTTTVGTDQQYTFWIKGRCIYNWIFHDNIMINTGPIRVNGAYGSIHNNQLRWTIPFKGYFTSITGEPLMFRFDSDTYSNIDVTNNKSNIKNLFYSVNANQHQWEGFTFSDNVSNTVNFNNILGSREYEEPLTWTYGHDLNIGGATYYNKIRDGLTNLFPTPTWHVTYDDGVNYNKINGANISIDRYWTPIGDRSLLIDNRDNTPLESIYQITIPVPEEHKEDGLYVVKVKYRLDSLVTLSTNPEEFGLTMLDSNRNRIGTQAENWAFGATDRGRTYTSPDSLLSEVMRNVSLKPGTEYIRFSFGLETNDPIKMWIDAVQLTPGTNGGEWVIPESPYARPRFRRDDQGYAISSITTGNPTIVTLSSAPDTFMLETLVGFYQMWDDNWNDQFGKVTDITGSVITVDFNSTGFTYSGGGYLGNVGYTTIRPGPQPADINERPYLNYFDRDHTEISDKRELWTESLNAKIVYADSIVGITAIDNTSIVEFATIDDVINFPGTLSVGSRIIITEVSGADYIIEDTAPVPVNRRDSVIVIPTNSGADFAIMQRINGLVKLSWIKQRGRRASEAINRTRYMAGLWESLGGVYIDNAGDVRDTLDTETVMLSRNFRLEGSHRALGPYNANKVQGSTLVVNYNDPTAIAVINDTTTAAGYGEGMSIEGVMFQVISPVNIVLDLDEMRGGTIRNVTVEGNSGGGGPYPNIGMRGSAWIHMNPQELHITGCDTLVKFIPGGESGDTPTTTTTFSNCRFGEAGMGFFADHDAGSFTFDQKTTFEQLDTAYWGASSYVTFDNCHFEKTPNANNSSAVTIFRDTTGNTFLDNGRFYFVNNRISRGAGVTGSKFLQLGGLLSADIMHNEFGQTDTVLAVAPTDTVSIINYAFNTETPSGASNYPSTKSLFEANYYNDNPRLRMNIWGSGIVANTPIENQSKDSIITSIMTLYLDNIKKDSLTDVALSLANDSTGIVSYHFKPKGNTASGTTNVSGVANITHNLPFTPSTVICTNTDGSNFNRTITVTAITSTTFTVTIADSTTGTGLNNGSYSFYWIAIE